MRWCGAVPVARRRAIANRPTESQGVAMKVALNAAVRIIPPSPVSDHWAAENLLERRRYKLSAEAAAVLVSACRPDDPADLAKRVATNDAQGRPPEYWATVVDSLSR